MPLYTYIVSFKGSTYAAQGSYSNFKGFVSSWSGDLPENVLPGLTPSMKKELSYKAYRGDFAEVPNRKHVWRKTIDLNGEEFVVYAIQTQIQPGAQPHSLRSLDGAKAPPVSSTRRVSPNFQPPSCFYFIAASSFDLNRAAPVVQVGETRTGASIVSQE